MAAVITIGSLSLAADGKTLTGTLSGGTGSGYTISSAAGLGPKLRLPGNNDHYFPIASQSISGTTLTVVLGLTVGTGETPTFDLTTAATISDSGANTVTGQTNLAITNSSAVTVAQILLTNASVAPTNIESPWPITGGSNGLGPLHVTLGPSTGDYAFEWVADCTEMAILSTYGAPHYRTDGAADATINGTYGTSPFWAVMSLGSGMAAGKHLFQADIGIFTGLRIVGGARTMHAVPATKRTMLPSSAAINATSTGINLSGLYTAVNSTWGYFSGGSNVGTRVQTQFTGTGLELAALLHINDTWASKIDGTWSARFVTGSAAANNIPGYFPVAVGLSNAAHTVAMLRTDVGGGANVYCVRVVNGTKLSAGTSIGATSVTVPDVSTLAVGDWVKIDRIDSREWRQISSITGSGPYTVNLAGSALAKAHAAGVAVTSYSAPAGSITAWVEKTLTGKTVLGFGDSNTQGWNEYGFGTPSPDGVDYSAYDTRQSAIFQGADGLNMDFINLGVQGQTSANMVSRQADITNTIRAGSGGWDYITVWAGTNDINATTTTIAQYQANIQSIVTTALTVLKTGGKIILIPPATPSSTNPGGLSPATATTACIAVAAGDPSRVVVASNLFANLILADYNGLHFNASGRVKIGAALQPYLIGGDIVNSAAYFGTP